MFFGIVNERVKVWSQVHNTNTFQSVRALATKYGCFGGFFTGLTACIYREVPQFGLYYLIYEKSIQEISHNFNTAHVTFYTFQKQVGLMHYTKGI